MNFIYKNILALPNLKPYTKHNKKLSCHIEAARCFEFVCSQLQHIYSAVPYYQLLRLQLY